MKIEFSDKKPLYKPTHLEELSNEIKQKIVEKNLNIFQKIFKFLFGKKKIYYLLLIFMLLGSVRNFVSI